MDDLWWMSSLTELLCCNTGTKVAMSLLALTWKNLSPTAKDEELVQRVELRMCWALSVSLLFTFKFNAWGHLVSSC